MVRILGSKQFKIRVQSDFQRQFSFDGENGKPINPNRKCGTRLRASNIHSPVNFVPARLFTIYIVSLELIREAFPPSVERKMAVVYDSTMRFLRFSFAARFRLSASVSISIGLIALAGLDAETGVVMLLYLDQAWEKFRAEGRMKSMDDLPTAVIEGAVGRVRPEIMTI
jgi:hypothetical protein